MHGCSVFGVGHTGERIQKRAVVALDPARPLIFLGARRSRLPPSLNIIPANPRRVDRRGSHRIYGTNSSGWAAGHPWARLRTGKITKDSRVVSGRILRGIRSRPRVPLSRSLSVSLRFHRCPACFVPHVNQSRIVYSSGHARSCLS